MGSASEIQELILEHFVACGLAIADLMFEGRWLMIEGPLSNGHLLCGKPTDLPQVVYQGPGSGPACETLGREQVTPCTQVHSCWHSDDLHCVLECSSIFLKN